VEELRTALGSIVDASDKGEGGWKSVVRIVPDGAHGLHLTCTDGEMLASRIVPAEVRAPMSPGAAVNAIHLLRVLKHFPKVDVRLSSEGNHLAFRFGSSRHKLVAEPLNAMPHAMNLPDDNEEAVLIDGPLLARAFRCGAYCCATEEDRYGLNGAHMEMAPKGLRVVATDGSRLAYAHAVPVALDSLPPMKAELLPFRFIKMAENLLGSVGGGVTLRVRDGKASLKFDVNGFPMTIGGVLKQGEFPAYRSVIPTGAPKIEAECEVGAFHETVDRVAIAARDRGRTLIATFKGGGLDLRAKTMDWGEGVEGFEFEEPASGEMMIGYNADYLLGALRGLMDAGAERMKLELHGELMPTMLKPVGLDDIGAHDLHVVMPTRLD